TALEKARVALLLQQLAYLSFLEVLGHWHRKAHEEARITGVYRPAQHVPVDALGRIAMHGLSAAAAEQARRARKEQLQVVIELRHRAHGRARGTHRIGLIDGDRR